MAEGSQTNEQEQEQAHAHSGAFAGLHSHDGGALHWHDEFGEHMAEDLTEEEFALCLKDLEKYKDRYAEMGVRSGKAEFLHEQQRLKEALPLYDQVAAYREETRDLRGLAGTLHRAGECFSVID